MLLHQRLRLSATRSETHTRRQIIVCYPATGVRSWALGQIRRYRDVLVFWEALKWTARRVAYSRWEIGQRRSRVRLRGVRHPLLVRLGESSDIQCLEQIFLQQELAFARVLGSPSPLLIMDLGANVGYSSIYLMTLFPGATVVAIEPDRANFEICELNLAPYRNRAKAICGGIWHSCVPLVVTRGAGDGLDWAVQVREAKTEERPDVEGWDIPSLLRQYAGERIGLLKIDIEGSEYQLFSRGADTWLPLVDNIAIEVHGEECREAVLSALSKYTFESGRSGEYDLFLKIRPKSGTETSA